MALFGALSVTYEGYRGLEESSEKPSYEESKSCTSEWMVFRFVLQLLMLKA
jgi:hypothetical protein